MVLTIIFFTIFSCLSETEIICRSATFDATHLLCHLTELTIENGSQWLTKNVENFEYIENHCLNGKNRTNSSQFIAICQRKAYHQLKIEELVIDNSLLHFDLPKNGIY